MKPTERDVHDLLAPIDDRQRADCQTLVELMQSVTGEEPKL